MEDSKNYSKIVSQKNSCKQYFVLNGSNKNGYIASMLVRDNIEKKYIKYIYELDLSSVQVGAEEVFEKLVFFVSNLDLIAQMPLLKGDEFKPDQFLVKKFADDLKKGGVGVGQFAMLASDGKTTYTFSTGKKEQSNAC